MGLIALFPPLLEIECEGWKSGHPVSGLHSGNLGDVIYSLPAAYALGVNHYILNVCADPAFGGRVMTSEAAQKLAPLLLGQGSIRRVTVIQSQVPWEFAEPARIGVDYVLDSFRCNMTEPTLHLIHRHALPSGINVRGENAWLTSGLPEFGDLPRGIVSPYLVVALTSRYRRWGDDYYASLLTDIPPDRVIFVGVPGDLPHKVDVPGAYLLVSDFQQLARILSGAALVLGNPSFPYALAEGLKLPRMVELPASINVAPLDPSGIAMHLHTSDSLRGRIWQALNLSPPELTTLREELHCARDQMLRMLGERETIESERTTLESERTTLENERTTLENERTTLENERMTLENERTTLESERTTLESERGEMRKRLDEARRVEAELRESLDTARKWALEYSDLENNFQILQASINKPGFLFKRLVWRVTCTHRAGRFLYSSLSRSQPLRRIWLRLDGVALSRPALSDIHTHQPISSRTEP